MPAFTFEKLSPPAPPRIAEPVSVAKPRSKVGQLLDRIAGRGTRKSINSGNSVESNQAELR